MRTALCAPRDARASRGLIGMWTSHIRRTFAELEASTSCRREFTDKENVRRRNLLVMARLARAPHCGSIKPLSASPRAVLSEGERARFSHPVYKSSVEPGSAPRSRNSGIFIKTKAPLRGASSFCVDTRLTYDRGDS